MAKKNKEVLDDIDLDDINGNKKPAILEVAKDAIEEAVEFLNKKAPVTTSEDDEWLNCLTNLKKAADKTWICIPHVVGDKLYVQNIELEECTGEQFLNWLYLVYPPSKNLKDITAEYCNVFKSRQKLFDEVRQNPNFLRFPKVDNKLPTY